MSNFSSSSSSSSTTSSTTTTTTKQTSPLATTTTTTTTININTNTNTTNTTTSTISTEKKDLDEKIIETNNNNNNNNNININNNNKKDTVYRICNVWELYNNLFSKKTIILDIRSKELFEKDHMIDAINFPVPKHLTINDLQNNIQNIKDELRIKEFQQHILKRLQLSTNSTTINKITPQSLLIFCYGGNNDEFYDRYLLMYHLSLLYHFSAQNFIVVNNGFKDIYHFLPFLCIGHNNNTISTTTTNTTTTTTTTTTITTSNSENNNDNDNDDAFINEFMEDSSHYPNCVIDNQLFLGNSKHALNKEVILKHLKITHIINITSSISNAFEKEGVQYLKLNVEDDSNEDLMRHFHTCIEFIERGLKHSSNKILVHCELGVSRSSTIVIAYLMHAFQLNLYDAFIRCYERRQVIRPNDGFLKQLHKWENILFEDVHNGSGNNSLEKVQTTIKNLYLQKIMG